MVCDSCQSKLSKICVPDKWKDGARNCIGSSSSSKSSSAGGSSGSGGPIKAGKTNKVLSKMKANDQWIPKDTICRLCKSKIQAQMHYCNDCAHKKGICTMCGKKCADVSAHRMSLV